jgi:hypothetical protein
MQARTYWQKPLIYRETEDDKDIIKGTEFLKWTEGEVFWLRRISDFQYPTIHEKVPGSGHRFWLRQAFLKSDPIGTR